MERAQVLHTAGEHKYELMVWHIVGQNMCNLPITRYDVLQDAMLREDLCLLS